MTIESEFISMSTFIELKDLTEKYKKFHKDRILKEMEEKIKRSKEGTLKE